MKQHSGLDLFVNKEYGPKHPTHWVIAGQSKVGNGKDFMFIDAIILRYLVNRDFDIKKVTDELKLHLEWR